MLLELMKVLSPGLVMSGRDRTACAYDSAIRSFYNRLSGWLNDDDMLTPGLLHLYEQRLLADGVCHNTISFYMRMLRAAYNKGVKLGLCPVNPELFAQVYTGMAPTTKRAILPEIFGILYELELSSTPRLAFCRDMFVLSFCLQGISYVDLAHLRKSDLRGQILTYRRAKTGSDIRVAVSDVALEIIHSYASQTQGSVYLLPIIRDPQGDIKRQYDSALRTYNRRLKQIGGLANISTPLTSYVARHSWATTAQRQEVPTSLIGYGLGHKDEKTTSIYLADFDDSALFSANEKVLLAARLVVRNNAPIVQKESIPAGSKLNVRLLGSDGHLI